MQNIPPLKNFLLITSVILFAALIGLGLGEIVIRVFLPWYSPLQTMPTSGMAPASDPASGLVRAKHGTSSPVASSVWRNHSCSPPASAAGIVLHHSDSPSPRPAYLQYSPTLIFEPISHTWSARLPCGYLTIYGRGDLRRVDYLCVLGPQLHTSS